MSAANSETFDHAGKLESNGDRGNTAQLERLQTAGGHIDDRTQPSLPVVHRSFANPAPLGLLSFATGNFTSYQFVVFALTFEGFFLISIYGVQMRGVATPNVLVGVLIFFGGVCQFLSGIVEFISGNTVSRLLSSPRSHN
jgi:succinate-acetate transporter protein